MPKTPPKVDAERMQRAEEYLTAAREHFLTLVEWRNEPFHYPLAYYVAGLAVECMLRAYVELVGGQHDPGHDLRRLAESGKFLGFLDERDTINVEELLRDVRIRWLNNHRYKGLSSLRKFLKGAELYKRKGSRTVKGDVVEYNWSVMFEAASALLQMGINQWEPSKKKWNG